jgi:YfiH family protein
MGHWREQRDGPVQAPSGAAGSPATAGTPGKARTTGIVDWGFTAASAPATSAGRAGAKGSTTGASPTGASRGDFAGLNLGAHVGDDPAAVEVNRRQLAEALDVPRSHLVFLQQEHGNTVVVAGEDAPWPSPPVADAVVTRRADLALVVLVADCTPVLLADRAAGVVGAVHAGRPGLVSGVIPATLAVMREQGAEVIEAVVGPSVCPRCYEVPLAMRDDAAATSPVSASVTWSGTPSIDISAGIVDQLAHEDVLVTWLPGCTRESDHLYSYRRSQRTGRFAGVVRLWS